MEHSHDFESAPDAFPVKLQGFEGPLDLLLHLIRRNELSIYDIPIALITQQYLDTIELMQELNLDVAGEFLVIAATLIHIKSKMLLPRPETAAGVDEEEVDPRDALVRRLLEHQRFKAAAGVLHEREQVRAAQWRLPDERVASLAGEDVEPELEVDLFSLLTAFQAVLRRNPFAAWGEDARDRHEVALLDLRIAKRQLERLKVILVAPYALGEEDSSRDIQFLISVMR